MIDLGKYKKPSATDERREKHECRDYIGKALNQITS